MHAARALLVLAAVSFATSAFADGPTLIPALGFARLEQGRLGERTDAAGVALELRLEGRPAPKVGLGVTFTWGLTDWDRAREWIEAGDRAGTWTTERFADVEAWVRRGRDDGTGALRLFGALFADMFLAMSYLAVPTCYIGSVGGATSHLQLDATGSVHLAEGSNDAWIELGGGGAVLPVQGPDWRRAFGPVVGVGARFGPIRVGARLLWSPASLNTAPRGGTVLISAVTLGVVR